MLEITRILTISTAHIKPETAELLKTEAETNRLGLCIYNKHEFGWFIYLDPCSRRAMNTKILETMTDLTDCFNLAAEFDCEILCLDRDAQVTTHLPVYEYND